MIETWNEKRWMLRLSRSLSRFETQDIMTQPQFNHYKGKISASQILEEKGKRWTADCVSKSWFGSSLLRYPSLLHGWKETPRDAVLSFGKKGKVLRVLPSGRWLPRNQG